MAEDRTDLIASKTCLKIDFGKDFSSWCVADLKRRLQKEGVCATGGRSLACLECDRGSKASLVQRLQTLAEPVSPKKPVKAPGKGPKPVRSQEELGSGGIGSGHQKIEDEGDDMEKEGEIQVRRASKDIDQR